MGYGRETFDDERLAVDLFADFRFSVAAHLISANRASLLIIETGALPASLYRTLAG